MVRELAKRIGRQAGLDAAEGFRRETAADLLG